MKCFFQPSFDEHGRTIAKRPCSPDFSSDPLSPCRYEYSYFWPTMVFLRCGDFFVFRCSGKKYAHKSHNLRFSYRGYFAVGRIFPETSGVGNAIRSEVTMPIWRSAVAARAPRGILEAKSQIVAVAGINLQISSPCLSVAPFFLNQDSFLILAKRQCFSGFLRVSLHPPRLQVEKMIEFATQTRPECFQ